MSRSRLDNIESLEKQLAELQVDIDNLNVSSKTKKIPPAVPPKKKSQPQVPQSAVVSSVREPSYAKKISPGFRHEPTYSNVPVANPTTSTGPQRDYDDVIDPNKLCHQTNRMMLPTKTYSSYSNIQLPLNGGEAPPIPPPLPAFHISQSKPYDHNLNQEEYFPPPSPVSSNYSELVRATANMNFNHERAPYAHIYQNEYPEYSGIQSATYEPLYEPINIRPQSNLSKVDNPPTSLFKKQPSPGKSPLPKEEEVDELTNMLVQSISDSQDLDIFGVCTKCGEKVVGETSGCSAMGKMYHIKCFCCHTCRTNLQGKPFYAVEGEPYCEVDYYKTLEQCSVCNEPILDRILRATGKPYHPTCFTCVVCGKSLDGIPFTVDAMNQIHCIEDFHKKFAPRCCVCELPIMPEDGEEETVRVVALDRSFHVKCYRCEDCGLQLSSEAEGRGCYPLDDHILCKNCNGHRVRMLTNVMTTDL